MQTQRLPYTVSKASLPLWSPEVSTPQSHSFRVLTGPLGSLPLWAPPHWCPLGGHILSDSTLTCPLAAVCQPHVPGLAMRWPIIPPPTPLSPP